MKTLGTVITVVCVLFACAAASAAELFTPPLFVYYDETVSCEIVNASGQTRTFTFEIVDPAGIVQGSGGNTLGPGLIGGGGMSGPSVYGLYYCHFTVQGKKDEFRAAIKLRSTTSSDFTALPAN